MDVLARNLEALAADELTTEAAESEGRLLVLHAAMTRNWRGVVRRLVELDRQIERNRITEEVTAALTAKFGRQLPF